MLQGRHASVRSHRRGGPRRRWAAAPWIIIGTAGVLVLSGMTAGYAFLIKRSCSGTPIRATVVAAPDVANILDHLSRKWADTEPDVDGRCAQVSVVSKDSAEVSLALGAPWDPRASGPAPDAWVPESTAWVRRAATDPDAERIIPDLQPSLARTPSVIAMPAPMAKALHWPQSKLNWDDLIGKFADNRSWSTYGQADWGDFRIALTDPSKSTAGLHALMAIVDRDDDGEVTEDERAGVVKLKKIMSPELYKDSTEQILQELAKQDAQGDTAALKYVSAFPALERDVLLYNQAHPKVPLASIYPTDGSADADHPYLILNSSWSRQDNKAAADRFMRYARSPEGRQAFLDAGFRDSNRNAGATLSSASGFSRQIDTLPRPILLPDSVQQTQTTWTALTRPTNILLVLDVSGSMADKVPGSDKTRVEMVKEAARNALTLFSDDASVGLWIFSSKMSGDKDYKQLVPMGKLGEKITGGRRADVLQQQIGTIQAGGGTALLATTAAAHVEALNRYVHGAGYIVVVLADGANERVVDGMSHDRS